MALAALAAASCVPRERDVDIEVVAVNDLVEAATLAHLLKHDSVYGRFPGAVAVEEEDIVIDGVPVRTLAESDPVELPWKELGVEVVIESTGRLRTRAAAAQHLQAGARKVIISAPAKGAEPADASVVLGVNFGRGLQPRDRSRDLKRLLHDQLPCASGHGPARDGRDQAWADDDRARVHGRSEPARRSTQGPSARTRRGDQHHSHLDRRGEGALSRDPRSPGPAERLRRPRPDADGLTGGPHHRGREGDEQGRDQRGIRAARRSGRAGGDPRLHRGCDRFLGHRQVLVLVDLRRLTDIGHRRYSGEGRLLVRQRVGYSSRLVDLAARLLVPIAQTV